MRLNLLEKGLALTNVLSGRLFRLLRHQGGDVLERGSGLIHEIVMNGLGVLPYEVTQLVDLSKLRAEPRV
ncbi:MAG: hypothetical protein A3H96_21585 [Acidobacteria bacterium RIFCSPLOWO2_02_FULL_67_36]|nr:MAG: hypothetical protein A3H96_21585 [Acidobacteria bacterium RIFCSPLOWO2_02_FULL_67_36]